MLSSQDIHVDNEFECIRAAVRPIEMNFVPSDSQVGEFERSIRTIKERVRSAVHGLPFKQLAKLMIQHMVPDAVRCLNRFPRRNGVPATMSPGRSSLASERPILRPCASNSEPTHRSLGNPRNTSRARSLGAIALNLPALPKGNLFHVPCHQRAPFPPSLDRASPS